jgi:3',5'-cyclic AMP phosphodiesterase CpdA
MTHGNDEAFSRRGFLGLAGAAAGAALLPGSAGLAAEAASGQAGFRFVHLADIHVQPELRADEGFRKCLTAVHGLDPRPDFILTGGDLVMDVLAVGDARAKAVFDLYTRICKDSDIPIRNCIGNHDVFGWSTKGKIAPDHASYGKKMAMERLGLDRTTYGFDHKGWHFCLVDDILPVAGDGYEGGCSQEDLDWVSRDLAAAGDRPKVVCTHIPIISVVPYRGLDATDKPNIAVSKSLVCRNAGPILEALRKNTVNLVLTGHLHQNERIAFDGTTHIGEGAVSGAWWKGAHHGNPEGFGVIDVRADGTFEHRYHSYGWQAAKG